MIDDLLMVLSIICTALGLMACCLLLFSNKTHKPANRLLALVLVGFSSIMLVIFLFEWNPELYAYIYRLPSPLLYILFPAAYLYAKMVLRDKTRLRKKEILHFLPALLYTIEILPNYFTSYQYRLNKVMEIRYHPFELIQLKEGVLPPYFHIVLLCSQSLLYVLFILKLLYEGGPRRSEKSHSRYAGTYQWIRTFVFSIALLLVPMGFIFLNPQFFSGNGIPFLLFTLTISILVIHLHLFFQPQILYGIPHRSGADGIAFPAEDFFKSESGSQEEYPENGQDGDSAVPSSARPEFPNLISYQPVLESHMEKGRPFLKQGYGINDLSRETGIPQHHLSALLNRVYKLRFSDYINGMRIKYITKNYGNPEWEKLTLEGIAKQAGFTSRTTFFNAIKKNTGVSPSEFIAQLKQRWEVTDRRSGS